MRLKISYRLMFVLLALVTIAGCATRPAIRTDSDPEASFSQYKTWAFYQPLAMEQSGYSSWFSDRIKENIRKEMSARGYIYQENKPDLRVNFQGVVQTRTDVYSMPRQDINYFYSYRARSYVAVPFWYDETEVRQYREGTLTVDLVDAERNRLVWTGAAIGRVSPKKDLTKRAQDIDVAIAEIFAQYPHRSGTVAPPIQ